LSGVGKTQITLHLAHLVKNDSQSHQQYSVIWMPALSMASFEQACTEIIKVFDIEHADNKDPKETFKDFLSSEGARKWFLIIDNADNMETLYGTAQEPEGIADFITDRARVYSVREFVNGQPISIIAVYAAIFHDLVRKGNLYIQY
jgi:hypothetical protein